MSLTIIIIAITAIVSYLAFKDDALLNKLLLWPAQMKGRPEQLYRLFTAGFVHGDTMHLIFNMITLYFFGALLEQYLGPGKFLLLYFLGIIVASVPSTIKQKDKPGYRSLGASGGVAAVVFAMIYISPWSKIYIFFAIPLPSILFALGYLAYTAYMAKKGGVRINHDAHLWGSLFGLLFMLIIDPSHGQFFIDQLMHPVF
jgi:membrane associated rhomboid family serine protease